MTGEGAPRRFDAHTHIFPPGQVASRAAIAARDATFAELYADPRAKLADAPALSRALEAGGFHGAAIAGFAFAAEKDLAAQGEYLIAAAKECADHRLAPLVPLNLALPGWRRMAEQALADGARGFGELRPANQGWDPLGTESHALCALAAEAGAVLLWHVSEPLGHAYPGKQGGIAPHELGRLAVENPRTAMIAAHLGGGLAYWLQMPEVRTALANVSFDTAAWPLLYDELSIARLVELAGAKRVLFASDYPLLSPRRQLERILPLLPPESVALVCGGNAETLLFGMNTKA